MSPIPIPSADREIVLGFCFKLPLRTKSLTNVREHWAVKAKRARLERAITAGHWRDSCFLATGRLTRKLEPGEMAWVHLCRIAPRTLDDDNIRAAGKHIRDQIAQALGVDDRSQRITWVYSQERGAPKEYAVRVEVDIRR